MFLWAVVVRRWMYSVMHPKRRLRLVAPLPLIEAIPVEQGEVEAVLQEIIVVEQEEVEEELSSRNQQNNSSNDPDVDSNNHEHEEPMWLESAALPDNDERGVMMAEVVILSQG